VTFRALSQLEAKEEKQKTKIRVQMVSNEERIFDAFQ
jgi:hypothetical protein